MIGGMSLLGACGNEQKGGGTETPEAPLTPAGKGELVFKQHCTTCHSIGMDMTGPALKGVLARWDNDTARLKAYIRNPSKLIDAGDPEAARAYEKFKPTIMTPFPGLSDEELGQILAYLKENGG